MNNNNEDYGYLSITASTLVDNGPGQLGGIFVSSVSGTPTITIYDNLTASGAAPGGTIAAQFTPVAGTPYPFPARYSQGLYVAIGGTVNATVFFN